MLLTAFAILVAISVSSYPIFTLISCYHKSDSNEALKEVGKCIFICKTLLGLCYLIWTILGNVWLFTSDWKYGYSFSLALLIFGYIFMFLIVFVACILFVVSTQQSKSNEVENKEEPKVTEAEQTNFN
jgi:hypothetical protein